MALKTLVKVGNITNLSDARYCAGMGVELLGFGAIPGQPNYIDVTLYQQMRGWVSGPKIVAELYGITSDTDLTTVLKNYAPDYIEMSAEEYHVWQSKTDIPFIVSVTSKEVESTQNRSNIAFLLIEEEQLHHISTAHRILVRINSKDHTKSLVDNPTVTGIALSGSAEIRPGFKTYDELSDILELLED